MHDKTRRYPRGFRMFDAVDNSHDTWKMALSQFVDLDLVSSVDATRSLKYLSVDINTIKDRVKRKKERKLTSRLFKDGIRDSRVNCLSGLTRVVGLQYLVD